MSFLLLIQLLYFVRDSFFRFRDAIIARGAPLFDSLTTVSEFSNKGKDASVFVRYLRPPGGD